MIRKENITFQACHLSIDRLGYLRCGPCSEKHGHPTIEDSGTFGIHPSETCDSCSITYADFPTVLESREATIEYPECRIF